MLLFFNYANQLTRKWSVISEKKFVKKLFQTALIVRIVWVGFSFVFFNIMTGKPFEFDSADAFSYHNEGTWLVELIQTGKLKVFFDQMAARYSDMGYTLYLGWQYWITGSSILIARLLKALFGAYTCLLIYRIGVRNFGENVGRMGAIFCMLMPNLILYSGIHTKEVEMVLLTVWFIERSDFMIRGGVFGFANIVPSILLAASLFFFRTVLGATALFALFTTLMFTSTKVLGMGKRLMLIVWILGTVGYFIGGTIANEVESVWNTRSANQQQSMEWRSVRANGNKFSKYATGAIFAPMIFVIPFPTIIETPQQENQKLINGGNYVKNVMAFFTIFALFWIIKNKKWREYVLLGSFTIGYLVIIAMSAFAQSERFHQPALPFELLFAAFGLTLIQKKQQKYFSWYMTLLFIAIVAWSWFKLAGRGMT